MGLRINKRRFAFYCITPIILLVGFLFFTHTSSANTSQEELRREQALQRELEAVLAEIEEQKKELQNQRNESATIERDINILDGQIREARLKLESNSIRIQQLSSDIREASDTINDLERKTNLQKQSLRSLLRRTQRIKDTTLIEVFLSSKQIAESFKEMDTMAFLKKSVRDNIAIITEYQQQTVEERVALEKARTEQQVTSNQIEQEKSTIEHSQEQKSVLLSASRNQEQTYEQIVAEREARASQIRSALFSLRDSTDINFGQALDFAREAEKGTGVRPAFLLAIITKESSLGANVGSCVITDLSSGQTRSINSGNVFSNGIHPTRDLPVLQTILTELGRDPLETRVSCPIGGTGYGGAMGPAQFIPSTWRPYAPRVSAITGSQPANPWNPRDAFTASSLFLADLGAAQGGFNAEIEAAGRYYAGGNWQTLGMGYANDVLNIAAGIQQQINTLESL